MTTTLTHALAPTVIEDGDILFFRGTSRISKLIQFMTSSPIHMSESHFLSPLVASKEHWSSKHKAAHQGASFRWTSTTTQSFMWSSHPFRSNPIHSLHCNRSAFNRIRIGMHLSSVCANASERHLASTSFHRAMPKARSVPSLSPECSMSTLVLCHHRDFLLR